MGKMTHRVILNLFQAFIIMDGRNFVKREKFELEK